MVPCLPTYQRVVYEHQNIETVRQVILSNRLNSDLTCSLQIIIGNVYSFTESEVINNKIFYTIFVFILAEEYVRISMFTQYI